MTDFVLRGRMFHGFPTRIFIAPSTAVAVECEAGEGEQLLYPRWDSRLGAGPQKLDATCQLARLGRAPIDPVGM
jgi:hypothetical protein